MKVAIYFHIVTLQTDERQILSDYQQRQKSCNNIFFKVSIPFPPSLCCNDNDEDDEDDQCEYSSDDRNDHITSL